MGRVWIGIRLRSVNTTAYAKFLDEIAIAILGLQVFISMTILRTGEVECQKLRQKDWH